MSEVHKLHITLRSNIAEQQKMWERLCAMDRNESRSFTQYIVEAFNAYCDGQTKVAMTSSVDTAELIARKTAQAVGDRFDRSFNTFLAGCMAASEHRSYVPAREESSSQTAPPDAQLRDDEIDWDFVGG